MTRIQPKLYDKIKKSMPLPCVDLLVTHKDSLLLTLRNNEPGKAPWSASQTKYGDLEPPPHKTTILRGRSKNIK